MKILNLIVEILTSPFSFLVRTTHSGRNSFSNYTKPLIILGISAVIVVLFVLYFYSEYIFN